MSEEVRPRSLADALLGSLKRADLVEDQDRLGRYRLLEQIGQGATSDVYRAHDESLDREVALKLLRGLQEDPQRFAREMQILGSLEHPGIVRIVSGGVHAGRAYYAMELIEGRTLTELLADGLELAEAVRVLRQVALACHAAHEAGVVHRDLKPANVLVAGERAVVADFGVAKLTGATSATRTGTVLGTPRYMAPEQWTGAEVDARTDVYALGAILYEALAGAPPFPGDTLHEVMAQVTTREPASPRVLEPSAPRRLSRLALHALSKDPARRPANAQVFAAELAAWEREGDTPDPLSRAPLLVALALLGAFALGGVGLLSVPGPEQEQDLDPEQPSPPAATVPADAPLPALVELREALAAWEMAPAEPGRTLTETLEELSDLRGRARDTRARREADQRELARLEARILAHQGRWVDAIRRLERVAHEDPAAALQSALILHAWDTHWGDEEGGEALELASRALKLGPEEPWQRQLAALLFDLLRGAEEGLLEQLEELEELEPTPLAPGQGALLRAHAQLRQGDPEDALESFEEALRYRGSAPIALRHRPWALIQLERFREAFAAHLDAIVALRTPQAWGGFVDFVSGHFDEVAEVAPPERETMARLREAGYRVEFEAPSSVLQGLGLLHLLEAQRGGALDAERAEGGLDELRRSALRASDEDPMPLLVYARAAVWALERGYRGPEGARGRLIRSARTALDRLERIPGWSEAEELFELLDDLTRLER